MWKRSADSQSFGQLKLRWISRRQRLTFPALHEIRFAIGRYAIARSCGARKKAVLRLPIFHELGGQPDPAGDQRRGAIRSVSRSSSCGGIVVVVWSLIFARSATAYVSDRVGHASRRGRRSARGRQGPSTVLPSVLRGYAIRVPVAPNSLQGPSRFASRFVRTST